MVRDDANKIVLVPLPHYGFDPSETAIPWKTLGSAGLQVMFATPDGQPGAADRTILTGEGIPGLLKKSLMAVPEAIAAYRDMEQSPKFQNPISYEQIQAEAFDGLLIPGGHDKGMRVLLESATLQRVVAHFFDHRKPVAAICHGLLLVARSHSLEDPQRVGRSVLWGRKTTGLTRRQEILSYQLTRPWLGDHYRTYETTVQDELTSILRSPNDYSTGPGFPVPLQRDSATNLRPGYTVLDGNYLSARWPGDVFKFSSDFLRLLTGKGADKDCKSPSNPGAGEDGRIGLAT